MHQKSIDIQVIKTTPEMVTVKLPFIEVPVGMNYDFFKKRLESGYFNVLDSSELPSC